MNFVRNFILYCKTNALDTMRQYRVEEKELRKRLSKISTGRPYETSIVSHMVFYVLSGWAFVSGVVLILFLAVVLVALANAGLWWVAGLIVGA